MGTYVASRLALLVGAPPFAGLAFALNPAVLVAATAEVADAVALAALMATVLLVVGVRWTAAIVAGVAAALSKEVMILSLLGVALCAVRGGRRARVLLLAAPSTAVLLWAVYARWRLGWPATRR